MFNFYSHVIINKSYLYSIKPSEDYTRLHRLNTRARSQVAWTESAGTHSSSLVALLFPVETSAVSTALAGMGSASRNSAGVFGDLCITTCLKYNLVIFHLILAVISRKCFFKLGMMSKFTAMFKLLRKVGNSLRCHTLLWCQILWPSLLPLRWMYPACVMVIRLLEWTHRIPSSIHWLQSRHHPPIPRSVLWGLLWSIDLCLKPLCHRILHCLSTLVKFCAMMDQMMHQLLWVHHRLWLFWSRWHWPSTYSQGPANHCLGGILVRGSGRLAPVGGISGAYCSSGWGWQWWGRWWLSCRPASFAELLPVCVQHTIRLYAAAKSLEPWVQLYCSGLNQ